MKLSPMQRQSRRSCSDQIQYESRGAEDYTFVPGVFSIAQGGDGGTEHSGLVGGVSQTLIYCEQCMAQVHLIIISEGDLKKKIFSKIDIEG